MAILVLTCEDQIGDKYWNPDPLAGVPRGARTRGATVRLGSGPIQVLRIDPQPGGVCLDHANEADQVAYATFCLLQLLLKRFQPLPVGQSL